MGEHGFPWEILETAEAREIDDAVTRAPVPDGEVLGNLAGLLKPVTEP